MAIVYLIITGTWVFFKCGSVSMAVNMIVGIVKTNPLSFLTSDVYNAFGNVVVWITIIGYTFMFVFVQVMRRDRKILNIYEAQPVLIQYAILVVLLVCLIFGLFGTVAFPNKSFIYFEF